MPTGSLQKIARNVRNTLRTREEVLAYWEEQLEWQKEPAARDWWEEWSLEYVMMVAATVRLLKEGGDVLQRRADDGA